MSKDKLLKTKIATREWTRLEIERSTKNFATRDDLYKVTQRVDNVFEKLGSCVDWRWALTSIVTLCGIFFAGVWAIIK